MRDPDATHYEDAKDDAEEWGEPLPARSPSRRLASMISARFAPDEADLVRAAAAREERSVSDFVRRSAVDAAAGTKLRLLSMTTQGLDGTTMWSSVGTPRLGSSNVTSATTDKLRVGV